MATSIFPSPYRLKLTSPSPSKAKTHGGFQALRPFSIPRAATSDPFVLQIAETLEDSVSPLSSSSSSSPPPALQKLRDNSAESVLSISWPSRKDEPFRFIDTSLIRYSQIHPVSVPPLSDDLIGISSDTQFPNLVIIDGHIIHSASELSGLPDGVYVGSILNLSSETVMERVLEFVSGFHEGDLFWSLNGIGAPDVTVVFVPAGCRVENPLHFRFYSREGGDSGSKELPLSNPRVLVVVEKGGEIGIIEEYSGVDRDKHYWANSVTEFVVGEGAKVHHSYIQEQSASAAHIKWTTVRQESNSTYELVEISAGAKLSRHNLHVQQVGPDTVTELSTLHLSVTDQTQDLHSKLVLDHPRGYSRQLHKCIVAHSSGQAVFDGNIKVNRYAQQTDAGQLTRSLLLEPRATVNVKPNLQIIADDVKCSHGAAISDLEKGQLFYFLARGIDLQTARKALVFSFGAEVIERLPYSSLREKVESHVQWLLEPTHGVPQ
ncbi:protein ABCI7, chloroplastic [Macadamia integrifolia]|uniref:protein ABCI7, chloroplastic n=1 Tax=Macadamia integrifolia TaxID=60698 RepID=UPI001C50131A|nr:protein ABCI7, chloroplastic [Macadamia integrifolia]